jgi:RNA polymerase sigma factor (sigma-70 family)
VTTAAEETIRPASRAPSLTARRRRRAAGERIAELFEAHGRMVYGVCRLILRDATEAEDAAQQTFLSAYRGLLAGQEPREPSAWLGTIARNECRARLRSRSTEPLTLVTEPSGDETQREVGRRAEAAALCTALAELPPQQRDAIVLREFYGLSYAEVAAALGLSGSAVETLLFRSRRRLQAQLRPLRAALGVLTLPPSLGESLAQALPGFGGGAAGAGVGAGVLAKLGSSSFAAKLAAATLALGTAGTVAGLERHSHHKALRRAQAAAKRHVAVKQTLAAGRDVPGPAPIAPARPVSFKPERTEARRDRGSEHEGSSRTSEPTSRDSGKTEHSGSGSGSSDESGSSGRTESSSGGDDHLDGGSSGGGETGGSGGDGSEPSGSGGSETSGSGGPGGG